MDKENNVIWKVVMVFCGLFFGVFVLLYLLQNRKNTSHIVLETQENDIQNLSNDWKNIFDDLNNAFILITKFKN